MPPLPREHGAWSMLLIPFLVAVGTAGAWNGPVASPLVWRLWWLAAFGLIAVPLAFRESLSALYFVGGLFYVRMHFAAARRRGRREAVQTNLLVHAGLAALLIGLAGSGSLSGGVSLAFVPVVLRAFVGAWRLTPVLRIKRLGWMEVVHSLVFAVLLVAGLRA